MASSFGSKIRSIKQTEIKSQVCTGHSSGRSEITDEKGEDDDEVEEDIEEVNHDDEDEEFRD
jgi:hypothetical protein